MTCSPSLGHRLRDAGRALLSELKAEVASFMNMQTLRLFLLHGFSFCFRFGRILLHDSGLLLVRLKISSDVASQNPAAPASMLPQLP